MTDTLTDTLIEHWPVLATAVALYLFGIYIYVTGLRRRILDMPGGGWPAATVTALAWPIYVVFGITVGLVITVFG